MLPTTPAGWLVAVGAALLLWLLHDPGEAAGATSSDDADQPTCRICYAGAEAGRLFSPCLCSGTMAHVHVTCLNEWRKQSVNARSVYQCDQCGYAYRTQRAAWASALEGDGPTWAASTVLVGLLVAVGAALPGKPERLLYDATAWRPRAEIDWWGDRCDRLVAGGLLPAVLGLAHELWERCFRRGDAMHGAFAALMLVQFVRSQAGPELLCCCCVYFWARLARELRGVAKALLLRFGEAVLEVRRT